MASRLYLLRVCACAWLVQSSVATVCAGPEPGCHEILAWGGDYRVEMTHADGLFACGETARLKVTALDKERDGKPAESGTLTVSVDDFGTNTLWRRTVDLAKENPFTVEGTLDTPGFLAFHFVRAGKRDGTWGVGFDVSKIRPAVKEPADFAAFWKRAMADLEKNVPADPQLVPLPERASDRWDYYRVSFATFGRRVYGFLSVPKDKSNAPFPVRVELPSAGRGLYSVDMPGSAREVRLMITVHPFEPAIEKEAFLRQFDENWCRLVRKYSVGDDVAAGLAVSREEFFYYPMILGAVRATKWLRKQPYVDRDDFVYFGGSQGGGLGLCLCALCPHFRKAVFLVPALCDLQAYRVGRSSGGLRVVEKQAPENREAAGRNVGYFDAAYFARRVKCPVRMTVGLSDVTCPPPTVYAAFNSLGSKDKEMIVMPGFPHGVRPGQIEELSHWNSEKDATVGLRKR